MAYIDLKKSRAGSALAVSKIYHPKFSDRLVMLLFFLILFLAAGRQFFSDYFPGEPVIGGILVASALAYAVWVFGLFFYTYLTFFRPPETKMDNLAEHLDFSAAQLLQRFEASKNEDPGRLLGLILDIPGSGFVWYRLGIHPDTLRNAIASQQQMAEKFDLVSLVSDALDESRQLGSGLASWRNLLSSLAVHYDFLRRFLFDRHIERDDLRAVLDWHAEIERERERKRRFWLKENLLRTKGLGKDWTSGFTLHLDKYAWDVTTLLRRQGFYPNLYGRQKETAAIERILARAGQNNVIVVGEKGVGKRTIVYQLAERIMHGSTMAQLAHKRVLELDASALLAGANNQHEVEGRIKTVFDEAVSAGNVILLVPEIHALFESDPGAGRINATELLLPYLSSSLLQIIGLTNYLGYREIIARNPSLLSSFDKIEIKELGPADVILSLRDVVPRIESHNQVLVLFQSVKKTVELANRYIKNSPFPEKAINILQEAAVYAKSRAGSTIVAPEHIEEVVHQKTDIPVGKLALAEKEVLLDLEKILHRKVIGQEDAIIAVADALRRSRSGIASEKKPIGSFLFLGPTGVGKTETAKALAEVYFGSEKRMIRFDMSEYQQPDSLDRLIGREQTTGQLTNAVMQNPFSLLLFDEVEKAHPNILNLFLQVLDDGRLTDSLGRTVDFTNTILIFTSNAGAELIRQSIQQMRETNLKERLLDNLQKQGIFRPEFLNRFDSVVVYRPLTEDQTEEVARLLLRDLNRRLKAKDIQIEITEPLVKKISELGYDPQFGARPLRRVIQDRLETLVAKKLLSEEIHRGQVVSVNPEEL